MASNRMVSLSKHTQKSIFDSKKSILKLCKKKKVEYLVYVKSNPGAPTGNLGYHGTGLLGCKTGIASQGAGDGDGAGAGDGA